MTGSLKSCDCLVIGSDCCAYTRCLSASRNHVAVGPAAQAESHEGFSLAETNQLGTFDRDGVLVVRHLIRPAEAATFLVDCMAAVRGDTFVPTWAEYLGKTEVSNPSIWSSQVRRDDTFTQLARPSEAPPLRHWRDHRCYDTALAFARRLLPGRAVYFAYDQCFYKPGGTQTVVYPHQDEIYWKNSGLTCWLALTAVRDDMAPVEYYPGSHERLLPHVEAPGAWNGVRDFMVDRLALGALAKEPISFDLEPGDAVFHSSRTVHGSGPNRSDRPRCGLALHFQVASDL